MAGAKDHSVTELLAAVRGGDRSAFNELFPLVYGELRRVAAREMRRERSGRTLQTTALVHEAYLRLIKDAGLSFENRAHFLGIAARAMRQILIEHARARGARKRGGHDLRVTFDDALAIVEQAGVDVVDLDRALGRLTALNERAGRIVEFRFFGGMSVEETAVALGSSPATVKREWAVARAWLYRELSGGTPPPAAPAAHVG
ncbi:MAG: sigma-70 family RNA polymerase sigma factor [Acidobacteriota bacterium]